MTLVNAELVVGNDRFFLRLNKDVEPTNLIQDIIRQLGLPEGNYRLSLIGDTGIQDGVTLKLETVETDVANVPLPEDSRLLAYEKIVSSQKDTLRSDQLEEAANQVVHTLEYPGEELALIYRFPKKGLANIHMGSKLVVCEGQVAFLFRDGRALDVFEVGQHIIEAKSIPLLIESGDMTTDDNSKPFKAAIYYVSTREYYDLWGTPTPITVTNPRSGIIRLQGRGDFSCSISDARCFIEQMNLQGLYDSYNIRLKFKTIIVNALQQSLIELTYKDGKSTPEILSDWEDVATRVRAKAKMYFDPIGVTLKRVHFEYFSPPPDTSLEDLREGLKIAQVDKLSELFESFQQEQEQILTRMQSQFDERLGSLEHNLNLIESRLEQESLSRANRLAIIRTWLDTDAKKHAKRVLWLSFGMWIAMIAWLIYLILKLGWDRMEPWTYIIGLGGAGIGYLCFVITQKELSPKAIYERIVNSRKKKNCRKLGFDLEELEGITGDTNTNK